MTHTAGLADAGSLATRAPAPQPPTPDLARPRVLCSSPQLPGFSVQPVRVPHAFRTRAPLPGACPRADSEAGTSGGASGGRPWRGELWRARVAVVRARSGARLLACGGREWPGRLG